VAGELSASTPTSALQPTTSSQPVTMTFGYIGVAQWAELIQPQHWASVITSPPWR